jgi:murein DD-endopeptidase MepM/ murein hydrolase activator NlpD
MRATIALGTLVAVLAMPTAHADPLVQAALTRHHRIARALHRIEARQDIRADRVGHQIAQIRHGLARSGAPRIFDPSRWLSLRRHVRHSLSHLSRHLHRHRTTALQRMKSLKDERALLNVWLAEWGTFRTCPVGGTNVVINNFGVIVNLPEVPVHVHQGNDIMAAAGTPIVAPFEGEASASSSTLGGLEVRVEGADGYAYNAHLSSYGQLGHVKAGDVIGYVGVTGDATGPHDHFEWHPADGPAVDPNPLLSVVC